MAERIGFNPEAGRQVQYNVKVGDRLGTVYEGAGSKFNIREELDKSERLGAPTFSAVYGRSVNEYGEIVIKITPDGISKMLMKNGYGVVVPHVSKAPDVLVAPVSKNIFFDIDEIVVIPTHVFQTPELLATLPESDIDTHFAELEGQLPQN